MYRLLYQLNMIIFKIGFKRTIKWGKYRLEMSKQNKTNNSNYLIVPKFNRVIRLFDLSFENEDDTSFLMYIHQKLK